MPDYSDILRFLANNPPQFETECKLHASLLELLAHCLRTDDRIENGQDVDRSTRRQPFPARSRGRFDRVHFG